MIGFYRDNWQHVGAVLFAVLAFFMGFFGEVFSPIQEILVYSFMALLAHQYEEYALPGGAGLVINAVMYGERRDYDRYPGNMQSMLLVNTVGAYIFYIAAIIFPQAIWLGLATMFFGFFQIIGHGIVMNLRGGTWYNPCLATAIFLFGPIGAFYIDYVIRNDLVRPMDYVYGAAGFVAAIVLILVLPIRSLMDRNSPYPMSEEDMARFNMLAKVRARGLVDD